MGNLLVLGLSLVLVPESTRGHFRCILSIGAEDTFFNDTLFFFDCDGLFLVLAEVDFLLGGVGCLALLNSAVSCVHSLLLFLLSEEVGKFLVSVPLLQTVDSCAVDHGVDLVIFDHLVQVAGLTLRHVDHVYILLPDVEQLNYVL